MHHYKIRITWKDGREVDFEKTTKWSSNSLRSWLVRKYPDCEYIYITQ